MLGMQLSNMDLVDLQKIALETAREAGEFLLKNKKEKKSVLTAEGRDIKLELDIQTEELIRNKLKKTNIIVLGEELGLDREEDLKWVIDPIDGTSNYYRGLDQCCVSISLMQQEEALLGVIFNFNNNEMYHAAKNMGAFLNNEPISVSNIDDRRKASLTTGFPASESLESSLKFLEDLCEWKKIRMFGSAALSCAYIASGKCDYYAERGIYLWDFAAGICIVNEAGGRVEHSLIDDQRYEVIISNGLL